MNRRPSAGRDHRVGGAVLAALVVALAALVAPGTAGGQDPIPPPSSEVRLTGVEATPWVTRDGTWRLVLEVHGAPADGQVRALISDQLPDRDAYHAALLGVVEGRRKAAIPPVDLADVPDAEGGKVVSLAVTLLGQAPDNPGWKFLVDGLRPGVYPVEVEVVDGAGRAVAGTVAFLTRVAGGTERGADRPPLLVAPVVTLDAAPSVEPDGTVHPPSDLLGQGRALVDGLALARGTTEADLPLTLAPGPESIEALGRGAAGARLVEDLRAATRGRQVLDAPYVEVPLPAWVEAGLDDELTRQRVRGNAVLTGELGPVDSSTYLAPAGLTPASASHLWDVGVRTVVLGPGTATSGPPALSPFTIPAGEGRNLMALTTDGNLTASLTRRDDPVLDRAGLAAELALLAAQDDDPGGLVLLAPPGWPERAEEVAGLADLLRAPEAPVRATTVAGLVAAVPAGPGQAVPGGPPADLGGQPGLLRQARAQLASYASMTGAEDPDVAELDQRLLLSGAAGLPLSVRVRYVEGVLATTTSAFASVEAPPRQTVTLTSSEGTVPLTLRSRSDKPVQVLLELDAGTRIQFPEGSMQIVTLAPGINRIPIPVHARAPGDTAVDITLRTPDGVEVLDEVRYTVRSTAIPGIGLVLSAGAVAFLVLWWARHWRSNRGQRATAR